MSLDQAVSQLHNSAEHQLVAASLITESLASVQGPSLVSLELAVTQLLRAVDSALRDDFDVAHAMIRSTAALLRLAPVAEPSETVPASGDNVPARGGLAPWQIRKVRTFVAENMGSRISTQTLAELARLSTFHFSRAFKQTFGDSPHRYLLRRRVEQAQGLMLTSRRSIAEIALDCGLVDQAHFGRIFRRLVGDTPAAWRRARYQKDDRN
jgi:AraC family transcriptional regulator